MFLFFLCDFFCVFAPWQYVADFRVFIFILFGTPEGMLATRSLAALACLRQNATQRVPKLQESTRTACLVLFVFALLFLLCIVAV